MAKPSLHEIAAMPYPASLFAMRENYNKDWGKFAPDGAELRTFKVLVRYSYTVEERETVDVEAYCREEAEELAADKVAENAPGEVDIDECKILAEDAA